MNPVNVAILRRAVRAGRIEWRKHAVQRLAERGLMQAAVLEVLIAGEKIQDYARDKPFPSALFLGYYQGKPLHVVAACDDITEQVFIITAYEPSLETFEPDYRTRRKS